MRIPVSVCMATYNGANFLVPQVNSILEQLAFHDELIIVDDCSTDRTLAILRDFSDPRIRIVVHAANQGHVKSFERALYMANSDVILLADQDDIWLPGRVDCLTRYLLDTGGHLVTSTVGLIDNNGCILPDPPLLIREEQSNHYFSNILGVFLGRRPYFGCAMALNRNVLDIALPIPQFVECHDVWLALISNLCRKNIHCEKKSLLRRIHAGNLTPVKSRGIYRIAVTRLVFALSIIVIILRIIINTPCGLCRRIRCT